MGLSGAHLCRVLAIQAKSSPGKTAALGILFLVLVVLVIRLAFKGPKTAAAMPPTTSVVTAVPAQLLPQSPARVERPPMPDLPENPERNLFGSDWSGHAQTERTAPTVRPRDDDPGETAPSLVLELTLTEPTDSGQHYAVISGKRVRIGDAIGKFEVVSISPGTVDLTSGGTTRLTLRMD